MLHQAMPPATTLPPFVQAHEIIALSARLLRPKASMSGADWAVRYLDYDLEAMPWHGAVLNWLADPQTAEVGLMGPAQIGKSEIGLAWIGRCIEHDPGDFLMCQPDKTMADDFVKRRIDPFVHKHAILRHSLLPTASADNVFLKQFRGMMFSTIWPVASQFRARPVRFGWIDDADQIPPDIEGQGDAVGLLDGRQTTHEGRDTKFVSSSPAREDGSGIEAFVESGTDGRVMPACPHCGERFEPDTLRDLKWRGERVSADVAADSAYVVCPVNGCILSPEDKYQLKSSLMQLPDFGVVDSRPEAGKRRRTLRVDGLLGFRSWPEIARKWREAQISWEARQDEGPLRTFQNVVVGRNYRSILSGEKPLQSDDLSPLKDAGWKAGTVPPGPVVLTVAVDVQNDRFECIVKGWADGMESWTIERFSIDVLDDGLTTLEPFRKPEHWRVLLGLFDRTWPLANVKGERSPPPLCVAIDTGGGGDKESATATENAKKFWNLASAAGVHPSRIMLLKGSSRKDADLVSLGQFADQKLKGGRKRSGPRLWLVNPHKGKHVLDHRLRRRDNGPGRVHFPANFDERYFDELTAEELIKGVWRKVRARNETLDLEIYAWFALLKPPFAQSRDHFRWLAPAYRIVWPDGRPALAEADPPFVVAPDAASAVAVDRAAAADAPTSQRPGSAGPEQPPEPPAPPRRGSPGRRPGGKGPINPRRSGWLARR